MSSLTWREMFSNDIHPMQIEHNIACNTAAKPGATDKSMSELIERCGTDAEALNKIREFFLKKIQSYFKINKDESDKNLLDNVHNYISPEELNEFRLNIINEMNSYNELRHLYYLVCKNT
jgi:hypothetical protein